MNEIKNQLIILKIKYLFSLRTFLALLTLMTLFVMSPLTLSAETTLASIAHLDDDRFRTDEGNEFRLIKLNQGCKLEARFYISFENTLYTYIFNHKGIISGTEKTFRYHYQKDYEGSLLHVTDVYQHSSARYNIHDTNIKKDFIRYKALFSKQSLAQC